MIRLRCVWRSWPTGAHVGEVFKDNSLSAWKPNVVRKQWEALMRRLESGLCDGVIVDDLTRFSRKIIEGERLVELAARGIRVWSSSGEYDLTTADGRRHFREAMVAAAGESDKIPERVRRGKVRKSRRGKPAGGGRGHGMPGWAPTGEGWEPGDGRGRVPDEQVAAEQDLVILHPVGHEPAAKPHRVAVAGLGHDLPTSPRHAAPPLRWIDVAATVTRCPLR